MDSSLFSLSQAQLRGLTHAAQLDAHATIEILAYGIFKFQGENSL